MRNKLLTTILLLGCAILLGLSVFVQREEDRIAPVIQVDKSVITYKEGEDYDELLEGVIAKDNRDGDITDKVFVEKILKLEEGKKALVRYAVLDRAKNIGIAERKIAYELKEDKEEQKQEQPKQEEQKQEQPKVEEQKSDAVLQGNPIIRLKTPTATIKKGSKFSPLSYVSAIEDDKDDQSGLYKRIHIDGKHNTRIPGTYILQYSVKDHEGNLSNIEKFTLIVQ